MMQLIIISLLITMMFSFTQMKHPLAMGLLLMLQTLMICLFTGFMFKSFWFSYILFLIFLGGMLVLFIYMTSLASNDMFNFSFKLFLNIFSIFFIMLMISLLMDTMMVNLINNNEIINSNQLNFMMNENIISIKKLYNFPTNFITLFLINYLFYTLIVSVKITNFFWGPLRQLN